MRLRISNYTHVYIPLVLSNTHPVPRMKDVYAMTRRLVTYDASTHGNTFIPQYTLVHTDYSTHTVQSSTTRMTKYNHYALIPLDAMHIRYIGTGNT